MMEDALSLAWSARLLLAASLSGKRSQSDRESGIARSPKKESVDVGVVPSGASKCLHADM